MLFILGLIALAFIIGAIAFLGGKTSGYREISAGGALVAAGALVITAFMCVTQVPPRSVGVATSFGKPVHSYENGLHFKAPWWSVHDMDGTIQNDIYNGDNQIDVRLANNAKAKVDASVQWQLRIEGAEEAFMSYKDADISKIQSNVIDRNLKAAINEAMAGYDPLNAVDPAKGGSDLAAIQEDVLKRMQEKTRGQVDVISVTLPVISFDQATQSRIDSLQEEVAKTRKAEQAKSTAEQEAQAAEIFDQSVSEEYLTNKCLEIVEKTGQSPLGCFPTDVTPVTNTK